MAIHVIVFQWSPSPALVAGRAVATAGGAQIHGARTADGQNKTIHGYGASTKGNVLLQYFGITNKHIKYIADRNPKKNNHFTNKL